MAETKISDAPAGSRVETSQSPDSQPTEATLLQTLDIPGYRILGLLGQGGMGCVYLGLDLALNRRVAIKVISDSVAEGSETSARFLREARSMAAVDNSHVVPVYAYGEVGGQPYFVMQLIEGESLAQRLRRDGRLPLEMALRVAAESTEALDAAWTAGIVHRDLKPSNILLDTMDSVRVADFGLAKSVELERDATLTQAGHLLGTPAYASPEQIRGEPIDFRSDIYSLGLVLFEMLAGERPFTGPTPLATMARNLEDPLPSLREARPDLPAEVVHLVEWMAAKAPSARPASYAELKDTVAAQAGLGTGSQPYPGVAGSTWLPEFLKQEPPTAADEAPLFVGREQELARLGGFLESAVSGRGRIAFVTGEAGTGKTALVDAFVRQALETDDELLTTVGGCSVHTGPGDPYSPFRQVLAQLAGDVEDRWRAGGITRDQAARLWRSTPAVASTLAGKAPDLIETLLPGEPLLARVEAAGAARTPWLPHLREIVERKVAMPPDAMLQQASIFGQFARLVQELAQVRPLLIVLEDLHWSDTGSIDLLSHLSRQIAGDRLLILGTFRPTEVAIGRGEERHPLEPVLNELERSCGDCRVRLGQKADREFVNRLIEAQPNHLGTGFRAELFQRTQGHALFTVELLRNMQERVMLVQNDEGFWVEGPDLDWSALPIQVEGVIRERIGRLSDELRDLLTVASVEGEHFTAEVLSAVRKADTRDTVRLLGQELERRHRLVAATGLERIESKRLSLYRFLHVLFQKYLYNDLDEAERAYLHEDVGTVLEELYGEHTKQIAAQLARHFHEAAITDKAVKYYAEAGQGAAGMTATREAIGHYRTALDLLLTLPRSPERDTIELSLQLGISPPLCTIEGWGAPAIGTATSRALGLADRMGGSPTVLPAYWFLCSYSAAIGDFPAALRQADRYLEIAQELDDEVHIAMAHWVNGLYRALAGELQRGRRHLEKTDTFYDPAKHAWLANVFGLDPGVASKIHLGWILAYSGHFDQSRAKCAEAIELTGNLGHPLSHCFSYCYSCVSDLRLKDWTALLEHAETSLDIAAEYGFPVQAAYLRALKGLAIGEQGQPKKGIELIHEGIGFLRAVNMNLSLPLLVQLLARCQFLAGYVEEALQTLDAVERESRATGELKYLFTTPTLRGTILAHSGQDEPAEASLRKGIELAHSRGIKSFELEAATELAALWKRQGKKEQARELLAPVYGWFTEGFDTEPLQDAKALLDELG